MDVMFNGTHSLLLYANYYFLLVKIHIIFLDNFIYQLFICNKTILL